MTDGIHSGFAETARGTIHFELSGPVDAPPLIFFGLATSRGARPMAEIGLAFRERLDPAYRFLTCDYPAGAGGSARRADAPPMTPDQVAADYCAIADAAGFDRFACAGYSYGANTGLQLAARHPERLTALIAGGWPAIGGDFRGTLAACLGQRAAIADPAIAAANEDFITYYQALQGWDDRTTAQALTMPRLNFADIDDRAYPGMGMEMDIGPALARNQATLQAMGWETRLLDTNVATDQRHIAALQPDLVVPLLREFLDRVL